MMPIAHDEHGNTVHISKMNDSNKNKQYSCFACNTQVKPRAIHDYNKVQPHFYHVCADACKSETAWHKLFKNYLFETGKSFKLDYGNSVVEYVVDRIEIEEPHDTKFGVYKPDITVYTKSGVIIYAEIDYSSKKDPDEYFGKWTELEHDVTEVYVRKIYQTDYTTETPIFDVIYHDGSYIGNYTKLGNSDIYSETIAKYKREHKTIREKMKSIESLDWFWISLQNYIRGSESKESIVELFRCLEVEERDICIDVTKRLKCVDLLGDFKTITQEGISDYINIVLAEYRYDVEGTLRYSFELVHITPHKYRIVVYPTNDINWFDDFVNYQDDCCFAYDCSKCYKRYDCWIRDFIIKNSSGIFDCKYYKIVKDIIKSEDLIEYLNHKIRKLNTYRSIVDKISTNALNCFYNIEKALALSYIDFIYDNLSLFEDICLYGNHSDVKYFEEMLSNASLRNTFKKLLPETISYIEKDISVYKKRELLRIFHDSYTEEEFRIYAKNIENMGCGLFEYTVDSWVQNIKEMCKDDIWKLKRETYFSDKIIRILDTLNISSMVSYSFNYQNHRNNFYFNHRDLNIYGNCLISNVELENLSEDEIVSRITIHVNNAVKSKIEEIIPMWLWLGEYFRRNAIEQ